jgi:hypothetical protein
MTRLLCGRYYIWDHVYERTAKSTQHAEHLARNGGTMKIPMVLLIGSSENAFGPLLRQHLEAHGCDCRFVPTYAEGAELVRQFQFDLILSNGQPGVNTLIPSLLGSSVSLFCAHTVEDGCLWLPVILKGNECLGASVLHPKEFSKKLDQILDEFGPQQRKHSQSHKTLWHA